MTTRRCRHLTAAGLAMLLAVVLPGPALAQTWVGWDGTVLQRTSPNIWVGTNGGMQQEWTQVNAGPGFIELACHNNNLWPGALFLARIRPSNVELRVCPNTHLQQYQWWTWVHGMPLGAVRGSFQTGVPNPTTLPTKAGGARTLG